MNNFLKHTVLIITCAICSLLLCSCDDESETVYKEGYENGVQEGVNIGYEKGIEDAIKNIKNKTDNTRNLLKDTISKKMFWGAIILVLMTLFGPKLIDNFRIKFSGYFKIPIEIQIIGAIWLYCSAILFAFIWMAVYLPASINIPILILLAGTIYPFWFKYIPALKQDDKMARRLNMAKVKSLSFIVLVIFMVFHILDKGIKGVL